MVHNRNEDFMFKISQMIFVTLTFYSQKLSFLCTCLTWGLFLQVGSWILLQENLTTIERMFVHDCLNHSEHALSLKWHCTFVSFFTILHKQAGLLSGVPTKVLFCIAPIWGAQVLYILVIANKHLVLEQEERLVAVNYFAEMPLKKTMSNWS